MIKKHRSDIISALYRSFSFKELCEFYVRIEDSVTGNSSNIKERVVDIENSTTHQQLVLVILAQIELVDKCDETETIFYCTESKDLYVDIKHVKLLMIGDIFRELDQALLKVSMIRAMTNYVSQYGDKLVEGFFKRKKIDSINYTLSDESSVISVTRKNNDVILNLKTNNNDLIGIWYNELEVMVKSSEFKMGVYSDEINRDEVPEINYDDFINDEYIPDTEIKPK